MPASAPALTATSVRVVVDARTGEQEFFDYLPPPGGEPPAPGARVFVPFGRRRMMGWVMGPGDPPAGLSLREIEAVVDTEPLVPQRLLALAGWMASHYCAPVVEVLHTMLPPAVRRAPSNRPRPGPRRASLDVARLEGRAAPATRHLTDEQDAAVRAILAALPSAAAPPQHADLALAGLPADASRPASGRFLLHGVAASGKTEVYLALLEHVLACGQTGIVLTSELSLTPQMVERFSERFPGRVAVLHSRLTDAERAQQWFRAVRGEASVVIGSRSALFAPLPRLAVLVVDEEDSSSYKQDRTPRYHAADTALVAAAAAGCVAVLGSATPRVTTYSLAESGHLSLLQLRSPFRGRWPEVRIADRRRDRQGASPLGEPLRQALAGCLGAGRQAILFLNRRGHSPALLCDACGAALGCPNCSVALVWHREPAGLFCHYCGHQEARPAACPSCGRARLRTVGSGTERLEQETARLFPAARVLRMDRDSAGRRDEHVRLFDAFRRGDADVLVGTQMVTKGFDLATVALVGVIDADMPLAHPDYRAAEEAFAHVAQSAGRTGRSSVPGLVIVQTRNPDHYAIVAAAAGDYASFYAAELAERHRWQFPPFARLLTLTLTHKDPERAEDEALTVAAALRDAVSGWPEVAILGPAPAWPHRLRGETRWQITVRGHDLDRVHGLLPVSRGWSVDVDPH